MDSGFVIAVASTSAEAMRSIRHSMTRALAPLVDVPRRRPVVHRARRSTVRMAGPPTPARPLGHVVRGDRARATVVIDVWLDFACPFSGKLYRGAVREAYESYGRKEAVCVVMYNQVQPWHGQSALAHETSLAVERAAGDDAFVKFCDGAFSEEHWDKFTEVRVESMTKGEVYDMYADLAASACGLSETTRGEVRDALRLSADAMARGAKNPGNDVTQALKFYVKLGRQTGTHVSPSTYVNGLFVDTSSGWTTERWHEFFDDVLAA